MGLGENRWLIFDDMVRIKTRFARKICNTHASMAQTKQGEEHQMKN